MFEKTLKAPITKDGMITLRAVCTHKPAVSTLDDFNPFSQDAPLTLAPAAQREQVSIDLRQVEVGAVNSAEGKIRETYHKCERRPLKNYLDTRSVMQSALGLLSENENPAHSQKFPLQQQQHVAETLLGNPDFMAGYALGMQQAHQQALGHVKKTGAIEVSVLACQHEQRRLQNRARRIELTLACGVGSVGSSLEALTKRLAACEIAAATDRRCLDRVTMRVESLEAKTVWAYCACLLRQCYALTRRWRQLAWPMSLTGEQRLCAAFACSWLIQKIASINGLQHRLPRNLSHLIANLRYWSWLISLASSHRAARHVLSTQLSHFFRS